MPWTTKSDGAQTKSGEGSGKTRDVADGGLSGPSREESEHSTIEHSIALKRFGRLGSRGSQ